MSINWRTRDVPHTHKRVALAQQQLATTESQILLLGHEPLLTPRCRYSRKTDIGRAHKFKKIRV